MQHRTASPVPEDRAVALAQGCRSAIGDRLRSVTYVGPEGIERLYHRRDLPTGADQVAFGLAEDREEEPEEVFADGGHAVADFESGFVTRVRVGEAAVIVTSDGLKMDRGKEVSALVRRILG